MTQIQKVVGIDLGTTFSVVAHLVDGQAEVIPNVEGARLTPSVVAFTADGGRLVGQLARRQAVANPTRTVASIKRLMGSETRVKVAGRELTPQEISSLILRKVKADAEAFLGEPIEQAVITVPAYFNDRQRQATLDAGRFAGLKVLRIINEPTAASLAYGLHREDVHTILVWDLGGGTFDVSILELGHGVFEVKAVNGNTHLGGDDWDQRIMDDLADRFRRSTGVDLRGDPTALQRLKEAAEQAKILLSSQQRTLIRIRSIVPGHDLQSELSREQFEALTKDLLERMVEPTQQALADANLKPKEIDRVVLVGGSTRMPAVQDLVRRLLGHEPYKEINPDEAVALGAAIQAGILVGQIKETVLIDVTPLSLGIETQGGLFAKIIARNTTIPTSAGQLFTTARDGQAQVDIHVLQGERALASESISLGRFVLDGIPPARRGEPQIEVTFALDANGVLHVSARDLHTEHEQGLQITAPTQLSAEEIERILEEAKLHAGEDQRRREEIQIGIRAEGMLSAAQAVMDDGEGFLDPSECEEAERAILRVKEALASGDRQAVRSATEALEGEIRLLDRKIKAKRNDQRVASQLEVGKPR